MDSHGDDGAGLAWPDHDAGPTPPPESDASRRAERETRRPLAFWDRAKFLVLLSGTWLVLVWAAMADDPNLPFADAARIQARSAAWLLVLLGLEALRQAHYLVSEHWSGYHRFWTERVFGGINRRSSSLNDWTRYRIARAFRWMLIVALLAVALGKIYDVSPVQGLFRLPSAVWSALPLIIQIIFLMAVVVLQFVAIFWFLSKGGVDVYFPEDVKTRFGDVWGQDAVLDRVRENIVFLENPEAIEEKGGYVPGGILLWGPPGTGKTLMAEAVAGETGKPFVFVEPSAFINMFMGVGPLKVKALFRKLRKLAVRYGGVIVFFDEADSLGNRGAVSQGGWNGPMAPNPWASRPACNGFSYLSSDTAGLLLRDGLTSPEPEPGRPSRFVVGAGMGGGGGMGTLQALLAELSGLKKPRGFTNRVVRRALGMRPKPPPKYRILVMMATNMPQALDEALLRPGRIDRIYRVGYPSKEGRKRTYQGYLDKVSHEITPEQVDKLATMTPYATGATIKDLVNEALVVSIREGRDTITWRDILHAKQLKALGPPEDVEYIERERHAVAVHEACHAVASYRLQKHLTIDIATIEKGQTYLGMVSPIPIEEQFTSWRTEFEADVMVSIASLVGERMFFDGDNSSGVSADLSNATQVTMYMEGFWGMGPTVGSHAVAKRENQAYPVVDGTSRNMLETDLGRRVEAKLAELYQHTERLLGENRLEILAVAHALETYKTLTGEDIEAIIEGRVGPLVDGRPYHDPEFLDLAEQYHAKALAAHRGHSKVDAPLPVWARKADTRELEAVAAAPAELEAPAEPPPPAPRRPRMRRSREQPGPQP